MTESVNKLSLEELESSSSNVSKKIVDKDINLIGHIDVTISVNIGTATIPVEQLFALKQGDVLALNQTLSSPVTVMINEKVIATAELVAVEDNFGIKIIDIVNS